ncbi:MAG: divergent polysaccharide deacetylase family protein [Clostridia bacterium]|nr:divergent polysaccharide deacetylase family protein [Clostridia bacterium]
MNPGIRAGTAKRRGRAWGFLLFLNLLLPLVTYYAPVTPLPVDPGPDRETVFPGYTTFAASCLILPGGEPGTGSFSLTRLLPVRRFPPRQELPLSLPRKTRVALILDDVGFVREPVEAFFSIKAPLTFAVLPWGEYSQHHAEKAKRHGFEVILHLPLEPLDPEHAPGPGTLYGDASPEENRRRLRANIRSIPGIAGVNNHMGSKGTQDPALMRLVMEELKAEGLFFVDSFTIERSVGLQAARELGVPAAGRDLFLDHYGTEDIPRQLEKLLETALEKGNAIGILHPRPGAAEALAGFLPCFQAAGVEIVPVSELVE